MKDKVEGHLEVSETFCLSIGIDNKIIRKAFTFFSLKQEFYILEPEIFNV